MPTPPSTWRKLLYSGIIFTTFLLLMGVIGEIVLRCFFRKEYGRPPRPVEHYFHSARDPELGWKIRPGFSLDWRMKDKAGVEYSLSIRYDANGFKTFGDTATTKPKVFFIGDSYTASSEVSNEKSFFNLLKDSLEIEVFALGVGGYGNLQEYLVLDEWVDRIQPDLVVLEVCNNDLIDNSLEMERLSAYNIGERRPYLDTLGNLYHACPINWWQRWQKEILVFKWLDVKWKTLKEKATGEKWQPAEYHCSVLKMEYPPLVRSAKITGMIIEKIKNRLPPGTALLAFTADSFDPHAAIFRNIFSDQGIPYTEEPVKRCLESEHAGQTPYAHDGYHWNENGHRLVAQGLLPEIRRLLTSAD